MNTLDELLASTREVEGPTPAARQHGRDSLQTAVLNLVGDVRPAPVGSAWTRRRKLALAGVAVAAAAAVLTVPAIGLGRDHPGSSAEAATVLRSAGKAAGAQQGGWPAAAYWHVSSSYVRDGKNFHRDVWIAHHGQSVLHDTGLGPGVDPGVIPAAGSFAAGATSLTWDQLYALPTDRRRLESVLRADIQGSGPDETSELFVMVGDLLRESPAPPMLREALYDVAASISGVHVTGQVTDASGRTGTAVERDGQTYVIAPSDGQLLADIDAGVTYTYVSQGPAATAPALTGK
ncbi:MAG: CU044_5270 family protein [Jatrophihabitans sp.]